MLLIVELNELGSFAAQKMNNFFCIFFLPHDVNAIKYEILKNKENNQSSIEISLRLRLNLVAESLS